MPMRRSEKRNKTARKILEKILAEDIRRDELQRVKTRISSELSSEIPSNEEILQLASEEERKKVIGVLQRRPSRSKSGVSIIAVMSSPEDCPNDSCLYCPSASDVPQSYVDDEPAVMRGQRNDFDGYKQVRNRLQQIELTGHPGTKIDLIVMGGTFPARDIKYQKEFVKRCYDGLNGKISDSLTEAIQINETAEHRCIGLTIETRPDYCNEKEINRMLDYGTTRVELGVQIPDDDIYRTVKRGHRVEDVVRATKLLKDAGLKVTYHYMPNLPGSDPDKDLEYFKMLFADTRFMPDSLKIYPTLVVSGSELEQWYKNGEYEPYAESELVELLARIKEEIPPWVRVMRLHRDVPRQHIVAGTEKSNLRQIVKKYMQEANMECRCIRCREVGRVEHELSSLNFELKERKYSASGGTEYFISWEDLEKDVVAAILRLRIPDEPFREVIGKDTAIVRELHVYGSEVDIDKNSSEVQHSGYGRKLLERAEELASGHGLNKLAVISGVGARKYYEKYGYNREGVYMVKEV